MGIKTLRFGTRGSKLAQWQTNAIAQQLKAVYPDLEVEIEVITTKGDRVLDTALPLLGGKGAFTTELEQQLQQGTIDIAVHSLKDLPIDAVDGLSLGAIPQRADVSGVLISRQAHTLTTLPENAVIGTSSLRRRGQLLYRRSDLKIQDIRGNIDTRIRKLQDPHSPYTAIVLALAGISRLGMENVISQVLTMEQMLPAPGQGALAVQCRDDSTLIDYLQPIHHNQTALAVTAERAFLQALGGGCSLPVGAYASPIDTDTYILKGRVNAVNGTKQIDVEMQFTAASKVQAQHAGQILAQQALSAGAESIIAEVIP